MTRFDSFDDLACTPETLKGCLDYLYGQAMLAGLRLPAHFIGAAAEATSELIARKHEARPVAIERPLRERAAAEW